MDIVRRIVRANTEKYGEICKNRTVGCMKHFVDVKKMM